MVHSYFVFITTNMAKLAFFLLAAFIATVSAGVNSGKASVITLNDGKQMPVLGLGTWLNGSSSAGVQNAVKVALDSGYRHIDTAAIYDTEKEVGKAVRDKIQDGTIKREDVFITTKLWNTKHAEDQVIPALRQSLENLGMDFVDLYLIHWPISFDENGKFNNLDYLDTWRGMEEAQRLGLAKSIGVSNFNEKQLERLLKVAKVKPVVNQVEVNPTLTQRKLAKYCNDNDIVVVAYTPLGSMPESRATNPNSPPPKLDDPVLKAIGDKYNKNTVQVVLRYLVDRGLVPIPKSVTPSRIQANIDIFDFKLTDEEIQKVENFNMNYRTVNPVVWKGSEYYPFE